MRTPLLLLPLALLAAGCGKPHCPGGDVACVLGSMTVADFNGQSDNLFGGPVQKLVAVDPARLETLASADGGAAVKNLSGPLAFSSSDEGQILGLDWIDPSGCLPAFCMSACPRRARCIAARCAPAVNDGRHQGRSLEWLHFEKPTEEPLDFDLHVFAVSAPGCPTDVSAALAAGTAAVVSLPAVAQVEVGAPPSSSSGTTATSGTTTSSGGRCSGGALEVATILCAPTAADGSCQCQGNADYCLSASEYQQATGRPLPAQCNPAGGSNCFASLNGTITLVNPCCPGLRCVATSKCAGSVASGTCVQ